MENRKGKITSFYKNEVFPTIIENKNLIWISLALFSFGIVIGFFIFDSFLAQNLELLDTFFEELFEGVAPIEELSPIELTFTIFFINIRTSFFIIVLGAIFGVFPFLSLLANGMLVGLLYGRLLFEGGSTLVFLMGIVPHGIIEIPAIMIAASQGFSIGKEFIFPPQGKTRPESLRHNIVKGLKLFALLIPLLIVAAFVEVYVSAQLLGLNI